MLGIDTNILVRYLTQDEPIQSAQATKLIEQHENSVQAIFINNIVICELIWVLERGYKYNKATIVTVLKELFATKEFAFENHRILRSAVLQYESTKADFADILIGITNQTHGCTHTVSFDNATKMLPGFELLNDEV